MERLRRLRIERGLSQARLAARAELDPSTVNQIERGAREASPATLRKLADALDVGIAELLEDASPKAQAPLWSDETSDERRSPTAAELNAVEALDAFCDQLEQFLEKFVPENTSTELGENLVTMQRYMARTAAALSLPFTESAAMRPLVLPAATRFVELVRRLEAAAEKSGAEADEDLRAVVDELSERRARRAG